MAAITRESLLSLEAYAKARAEFRERVLAHKKARTVHLGEHVTLLFEDELTVRYQIQEMLRIEKVFEEAGIQDELDAYNPLVPDGTNLKATMLIEYEDPDERIAALARLTGIERRVWIEVAGQPRVHAIADEDLPRETETKTAAVHFLRFELDPQWCRHCDAARGSPSASITPTTRPSCRRSHRRRARPSPPISPRPPVARSQASRSIDQTRNSSAGPPRCGRHLAPQLGHAALRHHAPRRRIPREMDRVEGIDVEVRERERDRRRAPRPSRSPGPSTAVPPSSRANRLRRRTS